MTEPLRELGAGGDSEQGEEARAANERIAAKALRLRFVARIPFICECSDPDCREFVLLRPDEYVAARGDGGAVALPGHAVEQPDDAEDVAS